LESDLVKRFSIAVENQSKTVKVLRARCVEI
jgi:hypothetical protein